MPSQQPQREQECKGSTRRVCARQTDGAPVNTGDALARVQRYLAATSYTGTATVDGNTVTVDVQRTQELQILSLAGLHASSVTGSGSARAGPSRHGTTMTATTSFTVVRRTLMAVASIVTIAASVVGVPYLLWRLAGWPLPGELPSSDGIGRALSRTAVADAAIVKAVALAGWFAWALLLWSLLAETWAVIRGVPASRARLTAPFQGVARQLIASASLLAAGGMSSATATPIAAAPQPVVELRVAPADIVEPIATVMATARVEKTATSPGVSPPPAAVAVPVTAAPSLTSTQYTVQRHDSLWKIAQCQLGDPLRVVSCGS